MLERDIETAFVRYAESRDCLALKLVLALVRGWPDRTVILPGGRIFFAEFKTPKGRASARQGFWKSRLEDFGFVVLVPRSVGEAEKYLDELLGEKR
jgi:hypothetical protein